MVMKGRNSKNAPTDVKVTDDGYIKMKMQDADIIIERKSNIVSVSPANTAATYSGTTLAPVCIGSKLTFADIMGESPFTGIIQTLKMIDTDAVNPDLILLLFNGDPTAATLTNTLAPVLSTDISKYIGLIEISSSDWKCIGGDAFVDINTGFKLIKTTYASLYGVLLTTGEYTWSNANTLTLSLGVIQD